MIMELIMTKLEYIWIDGTEPTPQLRSKTKVVEHFNRNLIRNNLIEVIIYLF